MSTAHAATIESTDTGIPSGKLGMWLFLVSEVMFFTALIAAYVVLRMGHPAWPGSDGHLSIPLGTINTFVLICSSTTIVLAMAAAEAGSLGPARRWLLTTVLLGGVFLVIKSIEYSAKFSHHIFPSTNVFWSCYFTMTGLHALHVIVGMILNLWILRLTFSASVWSRRSHLLELGGLYWHFVDIVWIFLFPLLYLLR